MVLHNLFFLVLTFAAYFSLIPLFEKQVSDADAISRAKIRLFRGLGNIQFAAVVVVEGVINPPVGLRPFQAKLEADPATPARKRKDEFIPPSEILGDEIGQIMQSRND